MTSSIILLATFIRLALLAGIVAGDGHAKFTYDLADTSVGEVFLNNFSFEAIDDPTHGRV